MLLSAILEDRFAIDYIMQKELVRTPPDQLQGVERDARPDVTRSDILPRLIGLDLQH
jgi:hypothetical protein